MEQQKRVLVIGRDGSAARALRDVLRSDACCDVIEDAHESLGPLGDYALIVLDARPPESAEPVIEAVRRIPRSRRPLLFVLADDAQRLPQRLDPRIVTLLIRRPLDQAAVRAALEQTIRRILAVGGEDTLRRLREAGAAAPRSGSAEGGVLVVDDDKAILRLMAAVFRREGLDTDAAGDGDVAIEHLRRKRYRVLVLDLMMPRLSGWEVIGWLRSNPEFRPRTVIISTAADRNAFSAIDPEVVNAVFVKPFDVAELGSYVRACCTLSTPSDRRKKRVIGPL
ncbi:MAG TPA: response regulator [Thermoanaerobaculia bacterium]